MEKVKNMVVLVPAGLFIYSGGSICIDSGISVWNGDLIGLGEEVGNGMASVGLFIISLGVETSVIFYNILDA